MADGTTPASVSTLVVDEAFATGDDRFVELVRSVTASKYLAALADRWKKDPRAWAREQIFAYLSLPMDRPGHHPVVKRLFKQAEANRDDDLMAAFLVVFDRLVRRQRRTRYHYDWQTRQSSQEEVLFAPANQILASGTPDRMARNPRTGEPVSYSALRAPKNGRLFTYRTRGYLRRRVWRYFRWAGFQRPGEYPKAVAAALSAYHDEDFARGENILDNWSLMNIAFHDSPVLKFTPSRVELADGRSLGELTAAPRFEKLWQKSESAPVLLGLVAKAGSRLVRVWAMQLLKRHHMAATQAIDAEQLLRLLDSTDDEVQQFAASLLETLPAADSWPIETWLRLLETRSANALVTICDVMNRRVKPERLSLAQCVELACARATPVARRGLTWLKGRPVSGEADRAAIARLANAQCDAVGSEVAQFGLSIVGSPQAYRTDDVVQFFDSLNAQVRRGAWEWLSPQSPGYGDVALWSRLIETPYDDVRLRLVAELDKRSRGDASLPVPKEQDLAPIWTSVLLNVHRGGRAKLKALRQISQAISDRPDEAERLMPVLAVAIRSVRPPEVRAGLSAILSAVAARPELENVLAQQLPELRLTPTGAAT
jgi:hypothetical protein